MPTNTRKVDVPVAALIPDPIEGKWPNEVRTPILKPKKKKNKKKKKKNQDAQVFLFRRCSVLVIVANCTSVWLSIKNKLTSHPSHCPLLHYQKRQPVASVLGRTHN